MSKRCVVFDVRQKLRVLHILGELRPSGAECMLKVAAKEFASHGILNEILSTGSAEIGPYAPVMRGVGYAVHHIPFSKSLKCFLDVYKLMRARRYDVIHIHSERANFWFALTARFAGVPKVVSTIHAIFAFRGWLRIRRMIFRRLQNHLGVIRVAIGPSVQEVEQKHFGCNTEIVPNWYDSDRFVPPTLGQRNDSRKRFGLDEETFAILSVGNCSKIKNHHALIEAIALLPRDRRLTYLHVGAEEPGNPEQELAQILGISNQIQFLGQLENPLPAFFAADLYVMPSVSEGFGIAALEAAAVGLPMVLANVPGLRDFKHWFQDIHYSEPDAEDLRRVLSGLIAQHQETHSRRMHSDILAIRDLFGVNRGVAEYVRLYQKSIKT